MLLLVTGEFGRTPRLEYHNGRPGRDHWPNSMSMIMAGGGIKTGQIIGSTNAKGEEPTDRPLTPNDIWATCLHHLKINPEHSFLDHNGRPLPILPYGDVVSEVVLAQHRSPRSRVRQNAEGSASTPPRLNHRQAK